MPIAVAVNRTVSHHREAYHWILFRVTLDERNPVTGDIGEKGEKMCFFHRMFHGNYIVIFHLLNGVSLRQRNTAAAENALESIKKVRQKCRTFLLHEIFHQTET